MPVNPLSLVVRLEGRDIPVALFKRKGADVYWARFSLVELGQLRVSLKTADLRTAKDAARLAVFAAERKAKEKPASETYTLAQALAEFFGPGGRGTVVDKRTRNNYKTALNRLEKQIGLETDLSALSTDAACAMVREYLAQLVKEKQKPRSQLNRLAGLRVFFVECMRVMDGAKRFRIRWEFNPAGRDRHHIAEPAKPKPVQLSEEEIAILLCFGRYYACWPSILLCLMEGFRPAEASDCKFEDIDFERGELAAYSKKLKEWRHPPLVPWKYKGEPIAQGEMDTAIDARAELLELVEAEKAHCEAVGLAYDPKWRMHTCNPRYRNTSLGYLRAEFGLGEHVTFQAMRSTRGSYLRGILTSDDYVRWMGHDEDTARRFYWEKGARVGENPGEAHR